MGLIVSIAVTAALVALPAVGAPMATPAAVTASGSVVYTPRGTAVPVSYRPSNTLEQGRVSIWLNSETQYESRGAVRLADPTDQYNCHSYAWYRQSSTNTHFMPDPSAYWLDGSYIRVASSGPGAAIPATVPTGAIAVWVTPSVPTLHSAVVQPLALTGGTRMFVSKWADGSLMRHPYGVSPFEAELTRIDYYVPNPNPPTTPPPADPPSVGAAAHDFNGDGDVDLLAKHTSDATLSLYLGDGSGGFETSSVLGSGWSTYTLLLAPGDFDGAGQADLIARKSDGTLWMWPGRSSGGFGAGYQIGHGWGSFTAIVAPGDFSGDGKPDLIARTSDGRLLLYRGDGASGFTSGSTEIGRGWGSFTAIIAPGDFSGDGRPDIIARTSAGQLYLYRGNGSGGFNAGYSVIGNGWAGFTAIVGPGDFSGDGNPDLIARTTAGDLILYRGNGNSGFVSPYPEIGHGWAGFAAIV